MKIRLITAMMLFTCQPLFAADANTAKLLEDARTVSQEYVQKLGGVLKQQLQAEGPEAAIGVCKQVAPALAAEYSKDGRTVKRVSLQPRNQTLGTSDAWETQKLQSAEHDLSDGKAVATMEYYAVTEDKDGRWFRYLKAIPTQQLCLQCHGQPYQIKDSVKALLARDYPDDKATGYSVGSIRGGVSIRQKLD